MCKDLLGQRAAMVMGPPCVPIPLITPKRCCRAQVCAASEYKYTMDRLKSSIADISFYHHNLYLGASTSVKQFADPRIYNCVFGVLGLEDLSIQYPLCSQQPRRAQARMLALGNIKFCLFPGYDLPSLLGCHPPTDWTREQLPEVNYEEIGAQGVIDMRTAPLWVQGNRFIMAASDLPTTN